jgi:hypothetical protein
MNFMISNWYLFKCNKCKLWGVREVRTLSLQPVVFDCKFCGVKKSVKRKNEYGLALECRGPLASSIDASKLCQSLNNPLYAHSVNFVNAGDKRGG